MKATGAAVAGLGLIGFANSFTAVTHAARPSFGALAPSVPLAIDLGIAVFSALDIVLARLDMRIRWVRLIPWSLTAATIYLNIAGQHTWFGRAAHAVLPALWVAAVEIAAHVIRVRAGIAAGTAMDRIRASRWLLAPARTLALWRRMVLWETRSYPEALRRERARLLALTALQDTHGALAWRWRAPRRTRALYKLGELAPAPDSGASGTGTDAPLELPAANPDPQPETPAPTGRRKPSPRPARRKGQQQQRAAPDTEALMPLGWQIAATLAERGEPLTRDSLAAGLRKAGQGAGNAKVGALLERLKTEAPPDPADTGSTGAPGDPETAADPAPQTNDVAGVPALTAGGIPS